jgi:starvation-inducible outer membrane lipoprotein
MNKRVLVWALIVMLVIVIVLLVVFFILANRNKDDGMRVVSLPLNPSASVREYSQSRLYLYANGTFDIQVMRDEAVIFSGIGTREKVRVDGKDYWRFTYVDIWTVSGGTLQQSPQFIGGGYNYEIRSGVRFVDHTTGLMLLFR